MAVLYLTIRLYYSDCIWLFFFSKNMHVQSMFANWEDFTLPHIFLVIPPGIHVDSWSPPGVQVEFIWQRAQPNFCLFPPGFHLDSWWTPRTPCGVHGFHPIPHHFTQYFSPFHGLHLDSTWTPAVLIIYFVGIGLLMKIKSHDGPKNGFHKA